MSAKTAIITGVSSFVGCHLARAFAGAGWRVVAVTSRPRNTYEGIRAERLSFIGDGVEFAVCDLTDGAAVRRLAKEMAPDVWIQHAGYAENYASPDFDLEAAHLVNVAPLMPLYQALSGTDCGVVVTGSSMEYGPGDRANREDEDCRPDTPYGVSKLAETEEARRLAHLHGVPTRVARLYIPVGPYDTPGKLIREVVAKLSTGDAIDLSSCTQKRDFLGVADVCDAYLGLCGDFDRQMFDILNISSGEPRELRSFLLELAGLIGADPALLKFGARPMRSGEPEVSCGDNAKARAILNWQPSLLGDALESLVV